jgi:hypothetical protein
MVDTIIDIVKELEPLGERADKLNYRIIVIPQSLTLEELFENYVNNVK